MGEHVIEYDCECEVCRGTGLYVGIGERDGAAVVCHDCKGTGKRHMRLVYQDFEGRKRRDSVQRVFESNPGIVIGRGAGAQQYELSDFGGMDYTDWQEGKPFPPGSENRRWTCPAWWYQSADYDRRPQWQECTWGQFSLCVHFPHKAECWARWDREFGGGDS